MRVVLVCLGLVGLSAAATVDIVSPEAAAKAFADEQHEASPGSSNRDAKFLSVFNIVKFNNDMCMASDGNMGVCYLESECMAAGGTPTGKCAKDFGVCCVFVANTCGGTVDKKVSYIESPAYPSGAPTGMCMYDIKKCDAGVCQYKVEFVDHVLSQPAMGDCSNDTLMITNLDPNSQGVVPADLCGDLTGTTIYLKPSDTMDAKMTFNIVSNSAKWRVKITQIACTETNKLAPDYCLTYNTMTSGTINSFNNMMGNGESLNNHCYSHCIKPQEGLCDVQLTATNFDMGTGTDADTIAIGANSFSGSSFGTANSLLWNYTGTYNIPVCFGGANAAMNSGYEISYLMLPC